MEGSHDTSMVTTLCLKGKCYMEGEVLNQELIFSMK